MTRRGFDVFQADSISLSLSRHDLKLAYDSYDVFENSALIQNFLRFYSKSPSTVFVPWVCICT